MVTSKDVARAAGVSQATVSRVLSGAANVTEATRARVLDAMGRVGYVPNASARAMKTGRTGVVGAVVADLTNPFYPQLLEGLASALDEAGMRMSVWVSDGAKNASALDAIRERGVDGVVFTTVTEASAELRSALASGSPVVLVNRTLPDVDCDQVSSDGVAGGRAVADALVAHGRRRVAFVGGGASISTSRERLAGLREGLRAHGAPPPVELQVGYTHEGGAAALHRLADASSPPDAIVCANDLIAFGVLDGARARGLAVPEDVWVVGYDDVDMASWQAYELTTVRADIGRLATEAVGLLLRRLARPTAPARHVRLEPRLVPRRSAPVG